jgi:hypothetical protein
MPTPITTIPEALAYCEQAGYEPRVQHGGLGEISYWVCLDGTYQSYWSDSQFLGWLNASRRRDHIRRAFGWTNLPPWGWAAPDGTPETEWAEMNHPFPEDEGYADFASTYWHYEALDNDHLSLPLPTFS